MLTLLMNLGNPPGGSDPGAPPFVPALQTVVKLLKIGKMMNP